MEKSAPVTLPVLIASQHQGEVGDFFGPGEASGDRIGCRVCRDVTRFHCRRLWATV